VLLRCEGSNILIDTSTDLRFQALREDIRRIDAVLYTHTHADHVHGIDELRIFNLRTHKPIPIYGSPATLASLYRNFGYIFEANKNGGFRPQLQRIEVQAEFHVQGVPIVPLPLLHGRGESLGYRIGNFAYLTDCNGIPEATAEALEGIETLVIDALRFHPHDTHFTVTEAITAARRLGASRTILTHLSHDIDFRKHSEQLPTGVELAYDGQRIPFIYIADRQ
jgi:phosphoribosyl 1,2-cyclic phosphate phosphodiesterase